MHSGSAAHQFEAEPEEQSGFADHGGRALPRFLEREFDAFLTKCRGPSKGGRKSLRKTWKKMSDRGHEAALGLSLSHRVARSSLAHYRGLTDESDRSFRLSDQGLPRRSTREGIDRDSRLRGRSTLHGDRLAGDFVTQRQRHELALVSVELVDGGFEITAPGRPPLRLSETCEVGERVAARVWGLRRRRSPTPAWERLVQRLSRRPPRARLHAGRARAPGEPGTSSIQEIS